MTWARAGAFTKTLNKWRKSRDPIPVIWSHDWKSPDAHIGVADPFDVVQTERGLMVRGVLDIDDNPTASRVHKLMLRRSLKEFSFGYVVPPGGERRAKDGANELIELDLVEVGPTLKGVNPATELHGVKGADATDTDYLPPVLSPEYDALRAQARREMYALLTADLDEDRPKASRRLSLVDRELRRKANRVRLEAALGFDTELIERFLR